MAMEPFWVEGSYKPLSSVEPNVENPGFEGLPVLKFNNSGSKIRRLSTFQPRALLVTYQSQLQKPVCDVGL